MTPSRRDALKAGLGASVAGLAASSPAAAQIELGGMRGSLDAAAEGLTPGGIDDQSAALSAALAKAAAGGQMLFLPPGRYEVAGIDLPARAHLVGVPGQTRVVFRGGAFMLKAGHAVSLRLHGIVLDGGFRPFDPNVSGLLDVDGAEEIGVDDCLFTGSAVAGASLRGCAGRVERSRVVGAGTVGLELVQSRGMLVADNVVSECGDTGILVKRYDKGDDGTIVRGNRVSAVRADSGGTGQNGNGVNTDKANGVTIADNRIDGCAFSAIRCFSSESVIVTGNSATRSGEMALYVEFAFLGAVVASNLIDGAVGGIAFPNFMEHGGRLAVCTGNIVRNISGGPRYADGNAQTGVGIAAEADAAITGNVVENARWGLQLGWGPYLRDIAATGNVIRNCPLGIGVSVAEGAGSAVIANNLISGAERGAILGMRWEEPATNDLVSAGAEAFPHLTIEGNRVG